VRPPAPEWYLKAVDVKAAAAHIRAMNRENVKSAFGHRLRELRRIRGWSQEEFALRVGLDRSYVGGVERGERNVSLENICLLAAALEISPSELFLNWNAVRSGDQ